MNTSLDAIAIKYIRVHIHIYIYVRTYIVSNQCHVSIYMYPIDHGAVGRFFLQKYRMSIGNNNESQLAPKDRVRLQSQKGDKLQPSLYPRARDSSTHVGAYAVHCISF